MRQEMEIRAIPRLKTTQETKNQDIIYYKDNSDEFISGLEFRSIDFISAMSEMEKMDWTYPKNSIGFSKTGDSAVLFRRKSSTKWSAQVPIFEEDEWTGFYWIAYSDSNTVSDMLRLFFENMPWFGMLSWKTGKRVQ
jgi:hypothetical protein